MPKTVVLSWFSVITENPGNQGNPMTSPAPLPSLNREFINHFGEMGSGFAQGAVPVLDLGVSAVGYY
jgi:hypothetical protein